VIKNLFEYSNKSQGIDSQELLFVRCEIKLRIKAVSFRQSGPPFLASLSVERKSEGNRKIKLESFPSIMLTNISGLQDCIGGNRFLFLDPGHKSANDKENEGNVCSFYTIPPMEYEILQPSRLSGIVR